MAQAQCRLAKAVEAADTGAALLWREKADLRLPVLELLPDGSYRSVLVSPKGKGKTRTQRIEAGPAAEGTWDPSKARHTATGSTRGSSRGS